MTNNLEANRYVRSKVFDIPNFLREHREEFLALTDDPMNRTITSMFLDGSNYYEIAKANQLSTGLLSARLDILRELLSSTGIFVATNLEDLNDLGNGLTKKHLANMAKAGKIEATNVFFRWYSNKEAFAEYQESLGNKHEPFSLHLGLATGEVTIAPPKRHGKTVLYTPETEAIQDTPLV